MFKHPHVNNGKPDRQIVVPEKLRKQVMEHAHDSIMDGHLSIRKTIEKIFNNFYWPTIHTDVSRFGRSCNICQRTMRKGSVSRTPLQNMPLVDQPFEVVAVDLIGPIHPTSEERHRYILTLVEFATRYPLAIPLKKVSSDKVTEFLLKLYSGFLVPEEVLSDMGTQFVSECMTEILRLLNIRQLSTTPYHPMCNGWWRNLMER